MMTIVIMAMVVAAICSMTATVTIKGRTTIRWGTRDVTTGALATALIKKVTHKPRGGGEKTVIEDWDGAAAAVVMIVGDGDTLTVTCVDDTAITWPARGATVSMKVPGESAAKNFLVLDNNADLERKREGERTLEVECYGFAL